MSEILVSEDSATEQIGIMLDFYDIDPYFLPDEQKNIVEAYTRKLIKAIMKGRFEITEKDGKPVMTQHLESGTTIVYKTIKGSNREELAKVKEGNHYGRVYALLGAMSGIGKDAFSNLEGTDLLTAEAFGMLFLQA